MRRNGWRFSSYRTEGGAEVDLVVETERELIGIEIKPSRTVSWTDLRGLTSLGDLVGRKQPYRKWIVYRGERKQRFDDGVEAWVLDALAALR